MRPRLVAAMVALAAALGVVAWGLATAGHRQHASAGSISFKVTPAPDPSPTAASRVSTTGMRLVFHQTFQRALNRSAWGTCYPWAVGKAGCTNFSNPEYEWYLPSQVRVTGGALHLIARRAPTNGTTSAGAAKLYGCRSGMVSSYPRFRFEYGYVKIVAQIPTGRGLWSGLWLAAANLKWPPEIDLLESWGPPYSKAGTYFHPLNAKFSYAHLDSAMKAKIASGWHAFSILWTSQQITWYIDGQPMMTVNRNIPHQPMYVIANLASYTKYTGCSGQLAIRSIDVWQH